MCKSNRNIFFHSQIVWDFSEDKPTSAEKTNVADDTVGIIAAILGALLLIAIVIIGILLSKR